MSTADQAIAGKNRARFILTGVTKSSSFGIGLAFVLLVVGLSIASPTFLTLSNLTDVTRQAVPVAIIAFGATFVIGMGGIDLSVGSTLALSSIVSAHMMLSGINVYLAVLAGLMLGALIGSINGVLIAKVGITDFIVTMAVMVISRGIINVYTEGIPKTGLSNPSFQFLGQGLIGPLPMPVIDTVALFGICFFLLYRTRFGRYTLSIGSNTDAARLVGINIPKIKILVYAMTGLLSALAGILLTSRLEAAMPEAGGGYELDVIAAVVMGGTSLAGGKASLMGTAIGAVLMTVVRNGLNLLNVNTFWHQVVIGTIILIAVAADRVRSK
jgi:ribose transport system permease protein